MKKCSLPTLRGWFSIVRYIMILSSNLSIENRLMAKGIAKWLNEKEDYRIWEKGHQEMDYKCLSSKIMSSF